MTPVETLLSILDLERLEVNLFRGRSPLVGWKRVYGGQVVAQALVAANRTVEGRRPHSLHCYFLLGGDPSIPIIYEVERIRDGRSFTTRRVVAIQKGEAIFAMSASYHADEPGLHHQATMPKVPGPDDLPSEADLKKLYLDSLPPGRAAYWRRERPIEVRPVDPSGFFDRRKQASEHHLWFRATGRLPDDPATHAAVLAYASDMSLLDSATVAHGKSVSDPDIMPASLDHALWFHEDFRADDWLLYAQESPWAGHARGLGRGLIYTKDGRLIASAIQEGLVRVIKPEPSRF
ncbi:MAG: acyl-CoA thioesterase II [Methylobacterium sp.]|jgi:acyl-CoA thioesterase-2|nr:acyl-CoA thioesterase II [Methylobacterium sp.]MCA3598817.1 acyl-CoA thioesterase II [Methylobacterium sp.]MCA3600809.1 acyl-CoA thioesterase II [Methylobacterium sp.]MCA3602777.1 acyl-CoA thioesterase II [Methylobacterium sp.]MCA3605396.1 acyl-CoA thioesterase II [Methylobacterium sp.]